MQQLCLKAFAVVGATTAAYFLFKTFARVYRALKIYGPWKTDPDLAKYGKWSIVTGSTDGIGKEIAFQLASKGQNIVLLARNPEKLRNVAQEISSKHGVKVKYLKVDFSDDESIYDEIEEFVKDLDIGILVNNVGTMGPVGDFLDLPDLSNHILTITRINVIAILKMHQIVLPGMVERKRGLTLNISSTTSLGPMFPIYGATKAFVDRFSQTLSYEYEDKGVTIQTCLPALVSTKMTADVPPTPHTVQPQDFAQSLISTLGKERRNHGCFTHEMVGWLMSNIPQSIIARIWKRSKDLRGERKKSK